jgi:hypothetical protein
VPPWSLKSYKFPNRTRLSSARCWQAGGWTDQYVNTVVTRRIVPPNEKSRPVATGTKNPPPVCTIKTNAVAGTARLDSPPNLVVSLQLPQPRSTDAAVAFVHKKPTVSIRRRKIAAGWTQPDYSRLRETAQEKSWKNATKRRRGDRVRFTAGGEPERLQKLPRNSSVFCAGPQNNDQPAFS